MILNTTACNEADGKNIIAKDCQAKKFLKRMENADKAICCVAKRIRSAESKLSRYCPWEESSSSSQSSSSSLCCLIEQTIGPDIAYLITVNDLDDDAYQLLALLEQEVCALMSEIKDFEDINEECVPLSSSQSSSSSLPVSSSSSDPFTTCSLTWYIQVVSPNEFNIEFVNQGTVELQIESISFTGADFTATPENLTVPVSGSGIINIISTSEVRGETFCFSHNCEEGDDVCIIIPDITLSSSSSSSFSSSSSSSSSSGLPSSSGAFCSMVAFAATTSETTANIEFTNTGPSVPITIYNLSCPFDVGAVITPASQTINPGDSFIFTLTTTVPIETGWTVCYDSTCVDGLIHCVDLEEYPVSSSTSSSL